MAMRLLQEAGTVARAMAALVLLPPVIGLCSLLAIVLALATRDNRTVHFAYTTFARICLFVGGTELSVHGRDRIEHGRGYVVVSNHESNWDPPCLIAALPELLIRFVTKREITRIPIFGQALRLTGNVIVHRDRSLGDADRIRSGIEALAPDVSILFFAEGTRSRSGEMGKFKRGAFATAIRKGLPVLPVGIAGTRAVWTPGCLRVRKDRVAIEIGEPIPVTGLHMEDRERLRDQVEDTVGKLRARGYRHLEASGPTGRGLG